MTFKTQIISYIFSHRIMEIMNGIGICFSLNKINFNQGFRLTKKYVFLIIRYARQCHINECCWCPYFSSWKYQYINLSTWMRTNCESGQEDLISLRPEVQAYRVMLLLCLAACCQHQGLLQQLNSLSYNYVPSFINRKQ